MNIPQPIDHQCVRAQPQLATDQQVQLAIGREDVELEEIPGNIVEVNSQKETPLALTYEEAKESVVVERKIAKAGQKMISQIIYSLPGRIIQKYWLLGICLPWKPGDQEKKIIAQNYRLLGDYFHWDPGGQSCNCIKYHSR